MEFNYDFINDLYNITDLDVYIISNDVHDSPSIKKELQAMKERWIPVIPIRFEGYEGDDIRLVITPEGVDALPIDLTWGREPDEDTVQSIAVRMNQALGRYDRRKRDKLSKRIMKKAKIEENGYSISGWLIESGKRIGKSAAEGALEGAERFAKSSSNWIIYVLLAALLLTILGVALTWEDIKGMLVNHLMP